MDTKERLAAIKVFLGYVAREMDELKKDGIEVNFGLNHQPGMGFQVTNFRAIKRVDEEATAPVTGV